MKNNSVIYCDVCGDLLTFVMNGAQVTLTGVQIDVSNSQHPESKKVQAQFGKTRFDICYRCWLQSMGVRGAALKAFQEFTPDQIPEDAMKKVTNANS